MRLTGVCVAMSQDKEAGSSQRLLAVAISSLSLKTGHEQRQDMRPASPIIISKYRTWYMQADVVAGGDGVRT